MRRVLSLLTAIVFATGLVGFAAGNGIAQTASQSADKAAKSAENLVKDNPGAAVGAGAGAATGAAAGAVIGKSGKAAVVGGLLGALAGGAIGHYAYDRRKDRAQTAKDLNSQPSQGNKVKVEKVSASPQTVQPGGEVELDTTYGLLTRSQKQTPVTENWEITHNGKVVGNPRVQVERADGTYDARIPLRLPQNAASGVYQVRSTVKTASGSDTKTTEFRVG